jgi:dTDP-D-glucose 4,6-dehydratase
MRDTYSSALTSVIETGAAFAERYRPRAIVNFAAESHVDADPRARRIYRRQYCRHICVLDAARTIECAPD